MATEVNITDWTVRQLWDYISERGIDIETALVSYDGCGSHQVTLTYSTEG